LLRNLHFLTLKLLALENFYLHNPDYPLSETTSKAIEFPVNENGTPKGYRGINPEWSSFERLSHMPITFESLSKLTNTKLRELAKGCNVRNREKGFKMYMVNRKPCFWGLRMSPIIKAPTLTELKYLLQDNFLFARLLAKRKVTPPMIRITTAMLLRQKVAEVCGMNDREAYRSIEVELECVTREDECGDIYLVPRWAAASFRHKGYADRMVKELNKAP
jgi:hypothetical protein